MMRYLEYGFLNDHGLQHFDNWVAVFGEQKSDWELKPAGNGITVTYGHALASNNQPTINRLCFGLCPRSRKGIILITQGLVNELVIDVNTARLALALISVNGHIFK